jgi:hypothetical protein
MGVNYYTREDAGAPVLSGQAGALVALLDAVLVNGYGDKDPLGWTIAYTDTNKRVYRLDHTVNSGRYLRVDDSNAQYAIVNAYDAMTDIDTGTGGFPDIATPRYWRKSSTSDATARAWAVYGDEAFIHVFFKWSSNSAHSYHHHVFGDVVYNDEAPAGPRTIFSGSSTTNEASPTISSDLNSINNSATTFARNHQIPTAAGNISAGNFCLWGDVACGSGLGNGLFPSNDNAGVQFRVSPLRAVRSNFSNANRVIVGVVPGLFAPWATLSDTLNGTIYDDLVEGGARRFRTQALNYTSGSNTAAVLIDIDGPWR